MMNCIYVSIVASLAGISIGIGTARHETCGMRHAACSMGMDMDMGMQHGHGHGRLQQTMQVVFPSASAPKFCGSASSKDARASV